MKLRLHLPFNIKSLVPRRVKSSYGYDQDKRLVSKYTGAKLSKEQFNIFEQNAQETLRESMGTDKNIKAHFHGEFISQQLGDAHIFYHVLATLSKNGVVFNLEDNPVLLDKFQTYLDDVLETKNWPHIPPGYHQKQEIIDLFKSLPKYEAVLTELENH